MRVEPRRFFIDTNIFVYTFAAESSVIRAWARELVEMALTTHLGVISHQVVQEFLNVATRKFRVPLAPNDCEAYVTQVLAPLWHVYPSRELYGSALAIQEQSGYGFYDSLIVASALAGGCRTLYTQDMQHDRLFGSLRVVDPFRD